MEQEMWHSVYKNSVIRKPALFSALVFRIKPSSNFSLITLSKKPINFEFYLWSILEFIHMYAWCVFIYVKSARTLFTIISRLFGSDRIPVFLNLLWHKHLSTNSSHVQVLYKAWMLWKGKKCCSKLTWPSFANVHFSYFWSSSMSRNNWWLHM